MQTTSALVHGNWLVGIRCPYYVLIVFRKREVWSELNGPKTLILIIHSFSVLLGGERYNTRECEREIACTKSSARPTRLTRIIIASIWGFPLTFSIASLILALIITIVEIWICLIHVW